MEKALEKAKEVVKEGTAAEIDAALEELTKASHSLAEILYKQASPEGGAAPPPPGGDGGGGPDADVIDAEVVDKGSGDEEKK